MPAADGESLTYSVDKFGKVPLLMLPGHLDKSQFETLWNISKKGHASRITELLNSHTASPANDDDNEYDMNTDSQNNSRRLLWEDVDEGDVGINSTKHGAIWTLEGVDSKSRRMRWTALHFCIYGWAITESRTGKNKNARTALGYKSHSHKGYTSNNKKSNANYGGVLNNLIANRAYVDALDYKCRTPLMLAAGANLFDAVKMLIENGADVNISDIDGNTALHFAYGFGNASLAVFLEGHNANPDNKNLNGDTPIDVAGMANRLLPLFLPLKDEQGENCSIVEHSSKWSISQQLERSDVI